MTLDELNALCASLPATTHVVQWGGADVWKVGDKVFVIARAAGDGGIEASFKVSDIAFEMLSERPGCRPAPYLASRGMKWIQHHEKTGLSDTELNDYIRQSHTLVAAGLTKKRQRELGLLQD